MNDETEYGPSSPVAESGVVGDLLRRVRGGDEDAARVVVERLYNHVRRIVLVHLPRRDDPEDLMQEVFLKMFSKLEQFRGSVPFEHWVARIALTTCLDHLRRQRVRPEIRWSDLTADEQGVVERLGDYQPPQDADATSAFVLVERLLEQLPPADAWLLRQVEIEEKSLADVCAQAGWNAGATRVRLFRARHRLQTAMRRLEKGRP